MAVPSHYLTHPNPAPVAPAAPPPPQYPQQQQQQQQQQEPDATADFYAALSDPTRWVVKKNVPIFKPHQRTDPNTKKLIQVDHNKLHRIATNMQRMEQGGVPIRMTLGHTEPGKPETQQPPIGGYYRNARVGTFGPKREPAILVDEWLDPAYAQYRKNFPYRSAEYYDDDEQITGVALLTRDPYLDLGVVAYQKGEPHFTCRSDSSLASYTASPKGGMVRYDGIRRPTMYHLVLGELPVTTPNPIPTAGPPLPVNPLPPQAMPEPAPAPQQYTHAPTPTPYAQSQYGGPWPGPAYHKHNIGHTHPSGGAVYRGNSRGARYATEVPPEMGGGGGPGGGDPMEQLYDCLMQAANIVQGMMGGPAGGAGGAPPMGAPSMGGAPPMGGMGSGPPSTPFPSGGGSAPPSGGSSPTRASRYAQQGPTPRPRYYARPGQTPTVYPRTTGTVSGLPVGYQMELDKRDAEITQLKKQMEVVFYERDQADTESCVAEMRRLAALGYQVGEYEVNELKRKNPEERALYIQHITTKYQRVPTDHAPTVLGDPTPAAPDNDANRPLSREEMEAAVAMSEGNPDPKAYMQAVNYIRGGGPVPYQGRLARDPYEPSANGY